MVKRVKAKEKLGKISSQNKKLQNNLVKIKKGRGWNFNKKAVLLQFSRYRNSYKLLNKRRKRWYFSWEKNYKYRKQVRICTFLINRYTFMSNYLRRRLGYRRKGKNKSIFYSYRRYKRYWLKSRIYFNRAWGLQRRRRIRFSSLSLNISIKFCSLQHKRKNMRRFRRRKFLLRKKLIKRRSIFLKSFRRFGNFKKIRIKLSPFAYKQPRAYRILKYSKIKVRTRVFRYRSKLRRVHFINNYLISSKIPKKRLNLYFNYLPKRNKYAVVDLRFRGFLNNYITQFRINKLSYNSLLNYIGPASGGWRFRSDLLFRLLRRRKSMKKVRKYSKKLRVQGRLYCTSFISKIMRIGGCHNLQHYKFVMFKKTAIDHFIMKQNPLLFFFSTRYEDSQFNIDNDYVSYLDWIRYWRKYNVYRSRRWAGFNYFINNYNTNNNMGLLHIKTGLSRNMLRELSKVRGIDVGEGKLNAAFRSLKRRYRLRGKIRVKRLESVAFHNKKRDRLLISRRGVRSLFWRVFKGRLKRRKILKNNYNLLRRLLKIIPMLLFRSWPFLSLAKTGAEFDVTYSTFEGLRFFNKAKTSSKVSNYTFLTNDIVNNSLVSVRYDEGGVYPATKQSFYNMLTYVGSTLKIGS